MAEASGSPPVARLGIVGLGLIGGSIAARTAAIWPGVRIMGVDRPEILEEALARGCVHEARRSAADLADAELIVLAAPVPAILRHLAELGRAGCQAIVTDTGSTKRAVCRAAGEAGLRAFVGGHPMAGTERGGLQASRADLFGGTTWLLSHGAGCTSSEIGCVEAFVQGLGAIPHRVDPDTHDRVMAYVSHLPQLLAVSLMNAVGGHVGLAELRLAGRGLDDMTRLAASPPEIWEGIVETNQDYVTEALAAVSGEWPLTGSVRGTDLQRAFARAAAHRAQMKGGGAA
jgi:prephenate dehydrogenase